ncbi:MAG TPA: hypothetical protein VJY85_09235 [Candidatus Limnocylindria bacterium]|nr:hypothetical protein [Candidatus Limnocylindria bacterium]
MDGVIFAAVVATRIAVPLAIPRFPLPAMLAALVMDGIDQTIFQTVTSLDLSGYQAYDKALDVYYLSIAYVATLRNWTNFSAYGVSRFLYYYRLVGVVLFELTQLRWVLLVFPNTFEYFFDFYEGVRTRWDPRRMSRSLLIGGAAFIWIFIKLPQEWWIHVAQLDMTDFIKEEVFGVPAESTWTEAITANPTVVLVAAILVALLAVLGWWLLTRRLPAADRPFTLDADSQQPAVDKVAIRRRRERMAETFLDRELIEKVVLVSFVSVIFGQMLPGNDGSPLGIAIGVGLVILVNTTVSEWFIRRGRRWGTVVRQFGLMLALNVVIVGVAGIVLRLLSAEPFQHALVFVLLLTLIVTLYDRYRPVHLTRFSR